MSHSDGALRATGVRHIYLIINYIFTLLLYPSRIYFTGCPGFSRKQNSAMKTSSKYIILQIKKIILGGSVVVVVEVVVEKNDVF